MCDPLSFKLFERPNLEKLKQVLASPYLYNPDLPSLFKYYREAEKAGSKGIECAKFSSLKEILDKRVAEESMVARGDNCAGVPDPKF